ncbi:MAG: amino acid permease [Thermoplasmata archaeon]
MTNVHNSQNIEGTRVGKEFVRKSSGLVRVMSPYSAFAYNVLNIGVIFPWVYLLSLALFPNANVTLGILLTGIFTIFLAIAYSGIAVTMPRTGGDYIFQSRTLKPYLGFAIVATMIIVFFFQWAAISGWLVSVLGLAPMFMGFGLIYHNMNLVNLSSFFLTPTGIWITTIITGAVATMVLSFGFKWFVKIQWWMWYGFLLSTTLMIIFFALTPTTSFISKFNNNMAFLVPSVHNYYQYVYIQSIKSGFTPYTGKGFSFIATLAVMPIALTSLGWVGYAQEQAGEIQKASSLKHQFFINVGGGIFSTILMMLLSFFLIRSVGQQWLAAAAYGNYLTAQVSMPIAPWFSDLSVVLTNNPVLFFLLIVGIFLNAVQIVFNVAVGWTRVAFAMSMDRVLPKYLSNVNSRLHTPVLAYLTYFILGYVLMGYIYNFVPSYIYFALAVTAVATIMYIGTALGASLLPFVKKQIYQTSPISKYKIGKIPLITLSGAIAVGFSIWMLAYYILNPGYGVSSPLSDTLMVLIFIFWIVYYFVRRAWLRKKGIELDFVYKEVPPT